MAYNTNSIMLMIAMNMLVIAMIILVIAIIIMPVIAMIMLVIMLMITIIAMIMLVIAMIKKNQHLFGAASKSRLVAAAFSRLQYFCLNFNILISISNSIFLSQFQIQYFCLNFNFNIFVSISIFSLHCFNICLFQRRLSSRPSEW